MINHKIDFIFTIEVEGANPNGDPLTGNMPRVDGRGFGEISDVCIKRKLRNRMQDMGHDIFVKMAERSDDGFNSLQERFEATFKKRGSDKKKNSNQELAEQANKKWMDVRAFGQVFPYTGSAMGIRGPVSISIAKSVDPINPTTMQITKSVNGEKLTSGKSRSSDTMGSKHFVDYGVYVVNGSVNCYLADKTGFDEEDLEVLKKCIQTLFVNDVSSARPDGSMEVKDIYWFNHTSKVGDVSSGKIKDLLVHDEMDANALKPTYEAYRFRLDEEKLKEYEKEGLSVEHLSGF